MAHDRNFRNRSEDRHWKSYHSGLESDSSLARNHQEKCKDQCLHTVANQVRDMNAQCSSLSPESGQSRSGAEDPEGFASRARGPMPATCEGDKPAVTVWLLLMLTARKQRRATRLERRRRFARGAA